MQSPGYLWPGFSWHKKVDLQRTHRFLLVYFSRAPLLSGWAPGPIPQKKGHPSGKSFAQLSSRLDYRGFQYSILEGGGQQINLSESDFASLKSGIKRESWGQSSCNAEVDRFCPDPTWVCAPPLVSGVWIWLTGGSSCLKRKPTANHPFRGFYSLEANPFNQDTHYP